ncbi:hypothetical protein GQ42DRAFT_168716 [Ramicandelaber brevisporus]|nr:hypothetical protein GQ42DRAFT_168716 [Ramicandelaber brevisporus]
MLTFIKRHYSRLFGSDTLKHEWLRFALSIITFFTMYLIMFSAMIVSDQRYYTNGSSSPRNPALRDLLYDVLPPVTLNYAAADKPIFVLGILTFVAIFMSVPRWLDALIAVRRFFWIGSIWVPLRAICVISTVLPPPSDWYKIDPIVVNASSFGDYVVIWRKIFARETATCTDVDMWLFIVQYSSSR